MIFDKKISIFLLLVIAIFSGLIFKNNNSFTSENSTNFTTHYIKIDLAEHEGGEHYGHTLKRHVGKDKEWLIKRLERNKRAIAATSFPDKLTAEKAIEKVVNTKLFQYQLNSIPPGRKLEIKNYELNYKIGYGIRRNNTILENSSKITIIVIKTSSHGFKIITAYPQLL